MGLFAYKAHCWGGNPVSQAQEGAKLSSHDVKASQNTEQILKNTLIHQSLLSQSPGHLAWLSATAHESICSLTLGSPFVQAKWKTRASAGFCASRGFPPPLFFKVSPEQGYRTAAVRSRL